MKCDDIDDSIVDGLTQPVLFSFVLDKPAGTMVFYEQETIHYRKLNKSVLDAISFYTENENKEETEINGETLTFTLQWIKI